MMILTNAFAALSDDTRFAVVERLMKEGELPAGKLLEGVELSAPAMSRHLKVLRKAGLINQRVAGTQRLYSVRPEAMKAIVDWTMDHRMFWEASLDRLEAHLALEKEPEE
ncbi:MAG: metalloregulator ArsR/SmtB family transcription factor [Pseudomonadota bacterium]